jgi:hypothetical protein
VNEPQKKSTMGRRAVRSLSWGTLAGGGIAAGLAAGSSMSSTPIDGAMLTQLGVGAGAASAVLGFVLPVRRP